MRDTNIFLCTRGLLSDFASNEHQMPDGTWTPARPEGFASWRHRLRAAWWVFIGKADALIWPDQ